MGEALGKNPDETNALAICALLHDNALTEYLLAKRLGGHHDPKMKKHCEFGQRNIDIFPFKTGVKDFILYHHERADGKGPFGIHEGEGPLEAELIAIADSIDVAYHLQTLNEKKLSTVRKYITKQTGKRYGKTAAGTMLEILDWDMALLLKDNVIRETSSVTIHPWTVEMGVEDIFNLANFIARIIDYKSVFTQKHSTQIASKAWFMGKYYKYDSEELMGLYLAAALHDIGKLVTPTAILEKPGKLTEKEFSIIMGHVHMTWELLKDIEGFDTICRWASSHHEKFDGTGYPFGKKAEELDFNSRLLTCLDIYQAVSEERPYHPKRSHSDSIQILYNMVDKGAIDGNIVKDMSTALAYYDDNYLPPMPQR
jgi:HD-GYP domain-containing protein (c-di-GMP phosphodiesterase class II)